MSVYIQGIEGTKELDEKLQRLGGSQAKKAVMTALLAGAAILEREAKADAPVRSGLTRNKIKTRKLGDRINGKFTVEVGVGAKDYQGETFYAAFVNWGHHIGKRRRFKKNRQWVEGEHWLEAAFEESAPSAVNKAIAVLGQQLESIIEGK